MLIFIINTSSDIRVSIDVISMQFLKNIKMKEQDCIRRFIFEQLGLRGEWVRLQKSWEETKQHQLLPEPAQELLGQALTASVLLSETIKFEGALILQAQGSGSIKTLVAQSTHDRKIRGLAKCDNQATKGNLSTLMGKGRLVITVESQRGQPYQGIVPLEGNSLSEAINTYFLQSEQLQTRVWLFANKTHAAGLLLQKLPGQEEVKEDWERILALTNTVTKDEMLQINSEEILFRLFNEEKVRLFMPDTIEFSCSCSRKKIEKTLLAMGRIELETILEERELIEVDCEFCKEHFCFDKIDVENLLTGKAMGNSSRLQH